MKQVIIKTKNRPIIIVILFFLILQSCNNGENTVSNNSEERDRENDSIKNFDSTNTFKNTKPDDITFNNFTNIADELEKADRQKIILMQIDSTYAVISLLDETKKEMTDLSPADLTLAERNKKSKVIFNINIIQNELTRALDASILINLRHRTDELAGISKQMEKNISHLQNVTQKLDKATLAIGRLTNILAWGLSKGWIKPSTPKDVPAEVIKATVH